MSDSEGERHGAAPAYDVQFHNRVCRCNVRAAVRISESNRNRHKLYFKCEEGECPFFEWWRPSTNPDRPGASAAAGRTREGDRELAESITREVRGMIRAEMAQLKREIEESITNKIKIFGSFYTGYVSPVLQLLGGLFVLFLGGLFILSLFLSVLRSPSSSTSTK